MLISACGSAAQVPPPVSANGKVVEYSLKSAMADGMMLFIGVGGGIDGVKNPTLSANVGDTIKLTLTSGDGVEHDIAFPDFNAASEHVVGQGSSTTLSFSVDKGGSFTYYCTLPGHRQAGMEGKFNVAGQSIADAPAQPGAVDANYVPASGPVVVSNPAAKGADIVRDPTDLPGPIGVREPQTVRIDLETVEIEGQLADGTTFKYWTFNGQVPGPFYRVRVGDTIEVHIKNLTNSTMPHSVDFHAVTGPAAERS
jgi:nitrite reductase (NO-forming)